jgi:DNA-binding LacI/PurR family transcriptional regulator
LAGGRHLNGVTVKQKKQDRSYLGALRKLRQMIACDYREGGWLPSTRAMSESLGVSRNTYAKALRCVEKDSFIHAYPKKGLYVFPEFLRVKKIGVVMTDAEDSPFFPEKRILGAVLTVLERHDYEMQLIQAVDTETIMDKALIHGVEGLIWILPSVDKLEQIREIDARSELPLVVVSSHWQASKGMEELAGVLPDTQREAESLTQFFCQRNHKKLAFIGKTDVEGSAYDYLHHYLAKAGVESCFIRHDENGRVADLTALSVDSQVTAVVIEGGARDAHDIFVALAALDKHFITDLYVHHTLQLGTIRAKYPEVPVTAVGHSNSSMLGEAATEMLMAHLLDGRALTRKNVDFTHITPTP